MKNFDENLEKQFVNTHKFSNHDINKVFTNVNAWMIGKKLNIT